MLGDIFGGLFASGSSDADYECQNCGTAFDRRRQVCPVCDGFAIDRREW